MSEEKPLKCATCGHRFDFTEAEHNEATMTQISIGCPECSTELVYHKTLEEGEEEIEDEL